MAEISIHEYRQQIEEVVEQGRYVEAVAHGKHILKQYPKHVATYQLLGRAMIEAGRSEYAADMFRRVLSADPEDMVAWVGMSDVCNQRDELDAAVWYLERAFELATDNEIVEQELRHLYGRRDGVETRRVQLTRGALARLYLKGDLLSRAISELRALLAEHPERMDLNVALAEALWRNEQRLEASEVCQQVLDILPYCLKANLILGEIWTSSGREEGQMYLRRAESVDPENQKAQELFGAASPLMTREARIVPLEYKPPPEEERPAWMTEIGTISVEGPPLVEGEAALVDVTAALEAQIEIPSWLEEIASEETPPSEPAGLAEPSEEQPPEEAAPAPAEEVPEWLAGIGEELAEEKPEAVTEEEIPEWLAGVGLEVVGEEEVPERPAGLSGEPVGMAEASATPGEEIPEWLAEPGVGAAGEEVVPSIPPAEQPPDWLAGIREQFIEEMEAPEETPTPVAEEASTPAWLESEGLPSGDEALAWLEQLAEGKEEELLAQAKAEAEVRMAEIMGRPKPTETPPVGAAAEEPTPAMPPLALAEIPDWLQELAAPDVTATEAAPEEAVVPPVEEAFGWAAFGEPEAPPEAVVAAEEALPLEEIALPQALERVGLEEAEAPAPAAEGVPTPAWLEGEGLPSGDEALAWLEQLAEGKEEKLRAQAKAEAEVRMAEIMGRPKPTEAPPVGIAAEEPTPAMPPLALAEIPDWLQELAPPGVTATEAAPEEAVAPPVEEAFGWAAFGEPEAPPEVVAVVEEAPLVEEAAPEEAIAPPVEEALAEMEEAAPVEEIEPLAIAEPAYPEKAEAPPVIEFPVVEEVLPPEEILGPEIVPPTEKVRWEAALEILLEEEEVAPAPVVEEVPGVVEIEITGPLEEAIAPPEIPTVEVPAEPFTTERAYLKGHPRDYGAWLALAQALWQASERQEALETYTRVIRSGKLLESVIPDLEKCLEQWPDVSTQRVLGDAYMKDGRLREALDIYRRALETL